MECVRLRVKDVDFDYRQIFVRNAKGGKERVVPLPGTLHAALIKHLDQVKRLFEQDLDKGLGGVFLPDALAGKYPNARRSGVGNTSSPAAAFQWIRAAAKSGGTTFMRTDCRKA
jgi:integrase